MNAAIVVDPSQKARPSTSRREQSQARAQESRLDALGLAPADRTATTRQARLFSFALPSETYRTAMMPPASDPVVLAPTARESVEVTSGRPRRALRLVAVPIAAGRPRRRVLQLAPSPAIYALLDAVGLEVGSLRAAFAESEKRVVDALDAIALELAAVRSATTAIEVRTIAAERGLETAIRSADVAAATIHDGLEEVQQLEARAAMSERALERVYRLLDTLADHFASAGLTSTQDAVR
jgi:hypothetical protein